MQGKTVVITGATSGIGAVAAERLAVGRRLVPAERGREAIVVLPEYAEA